MSEDTSDSPRFQKVHPSDDPVVNRKRRKANSTVAEYTYFIDKHALAKKMLKWPYKLYTDPKKNSFTVNKLCSKQKIHLQ